VGGLLLGAQPAAAVDNCIQDVWKAHGNNQNLTCTANDVRIAEASNIEVISGATCTTLPDGTLSCTCTSANITFEADYRVVLTAQTRYDIGLYFGVDGDSNGDGALTGQCTAATITQEVAPSTFVNLDNPGNTNLPPADQCGDIDAAHNPQLLHLQITTACVGDPVTHRLKLPNCTSWRQPGSNEVCLGVGTSPQTNDAFPGSPSKCNCQPGFTVNIVVESPTITVTKTASPVTLQEPGGDVVYTVDVKNNGSSVAVTITSLTDDLYGDLNGLGDCSVPQTIQPGATYSCSFTETVSGNAGDTITDEACASGHDANTPPGDVGPSCDTADVDITDVPSSATLVKTVDSADVTYKVVVTNTSATDTLRLTRLCDDKFGALSTGSTPVCVAGSIGSASNSTCPGLPVDIAAGDNVTCTFVGKITPAGTGTTTTTDTVEGTLNDNDGNTHTPFDTATVTIIQ
jgi:hypothetical protein